ncbi:patched family protein [Loa loa]|uniref:Patched family protein n=1 Tax=Loa loa TaxID=7209 RepID=A0A1S0UKK9_LOALO|nr:patched family protein [Loa loa]EJD75908.1 patched family protein [Loa loa]
MALFATANNGSLLETRKIDELTTFYKYITQIMPVNVNKSTVHYRNDLCEPFCNFNSQLWNLLNYQSFFKIIYPLSSAGPYKVNIGRHLFNRTNDERGNVIGVGTVAIYFTTFITDNIKQKQLDVFEEQVFSEVQNHNANLNNTVTLIVHGAHTVSSEIRRGIQLVLPYYFIVTLIVHGAHTVSSEIRRGIQLVLPYYFIGALLLIVFVAISLIMITLCYSYSVRWLQLILPLVAIISPILAALSASGLILLAGYHINMLILISPFLTLATGIGVDDAFLITNTWFKSIAIPHALTTAERLQLVLEKVGIGITVTSLTNSLGFALGCIAPSPEMQLFCATVSLSMLLDLLFQFFFYAPLQVLLTHDEPAVIYKQIKRDQSTLLEQMRQNVSLFCKYYSQFVASFWSTFIAVALLIAYYYFAIIGIQAMDANVDGKMLLPPNSQSIEGIRIMDETVWPDYLSINYIMRKPPNFSNPLEYRNFMLMVKEMEGLENSLGSAATMHWIKDYLRYLANPHATKLDIFFGIPGVLDMSQFEFFINTEPYTAWKLGTRYMQDSQNRTVITSMLLIMGYNGISSLSGKAKLLHSCRETCTRYAQYDMIPFDTDAELVDVILAVPSTTFNTLLFAFGAVGVVCFIFSFNIGASILAILSVVSISTGVIGFLQYWNCFLDPVLMVAVLITAGLSIDYTVHIIFHYMVNDYTDNTQRINASFEACALSMLQAGISTFLIMFPVLFAPIGIYAVISKAIILTIIFGLLHGLFIVPVLLTALPNCFINCWPNCYIRH